MIDINTLNKWGFQTSTQAMVDCWNSIVVDDTMYQEVGKTIFIDEDIYNVLGQVRGKGMGRSFFNYLCDVKFLPRKCSIVKIDSEKIEDKDFCKKSILEKLERCFSLNDKGAYWELAKAEQIRFLKELQEMIPDYKDQKLSFFLKEFNFIYKYVKRIETWADIRIYKEEYEKKSLSFEEIIKIKENIIQNWKTYKEYSDINEIGALKEYGFFIYGIKKKNKIIYIGETERSLKERWFEHLVKISGKWSLGATFIILYNGKEIYNRRNLQELEKELIEYFRPLLNKEGVTIPYQFKDNYDPKDLKGLLNRLTFRSR